MVGAGDTSAQTGEVIEGPHVTLLPKRWGDIFLPHLPGNTNSPGRLLLDSLQEGKGVIVTNRLKNETGECTRRFNRNGRWELSGIDYFMMQATAWHRVKGEGIILASGESIDPGGDHELIYVDIQVKSPASPSHQKGDDAAHDKGDIRRFPHTHRAAFGIRELRENAHSTQSTRASDMPDSELPPQEAYRKALEKLARQPLQKGRALRLDPRQSSGNTWRSQQLNDFAREVVSTFQQAFTRAVGKHEPRTQDSPTPIQPSPPPRCN